MANSTFGLPVGLPMKIVSVLLAAAFLFFGGMKLAAVPDLVAALEGFGLPSGSHYLIGGIEVAGAIGLFVRPIARFAAMLLVVVSLGAFATHVINPPVQQGVPALVLFLLSAYLTFQHAKG
ncbi:MAG: DoxX family protein [Pseudomonadota bacterium]